MYEHTSLLKQCCISVHKTKQYGYKKTFISSVGAKSQGRYSYYKMLSEARQGDLVRVKRGVYASAGQLANTMIDIDTLVPNGILCSFSAWSAYRLTNVIPQAFHVAVKRGRKVTLPDFPAIELHYMMP